VAGLTWGLENFKPGLASNRDPSDLCLLSSYDYWREPSSHPTFFFFLLLLFLWADSFRAVLVKYYVSEILGTKKCFSFGSSLDFEFSD
jgi:hypothetical protein